MQMFLQISIQTDDLKITGYNKKHTTKKTTTNITKSTTKNATKQCNKNYDKTCDKQIRQKIKTQKTCMPIFFKVIKLCLWKMSHDPEGEERR